jgi:hypothetical protein
MFKVTDAHITYMLTDLKNKGVLLQDLQENIIDHVCCLIEEELDEYGNFESYYQQIIPRFCNQELKELQSETEHLLGSRNIDLLKNTLQVSGVLSVLLLSFGLYYKLSHLKGTGLILFVGMLLFCLLFLPSLIALKCKDSSTKNNILLVSTAFLLTLVGSLGCLFKIMQWPYASLLLGTSTVLFLVLFVPMFLLLMKNKPEEKFTTFIQVILMLVVGMICLLMNL